jgi:hypothetical protein
MRLSFITCASTVGFAYLINGWPAVAGWCIGALAGFCFCARMV